MVDAGQELHGRSLRGRSDGFVVSVPTPGCGSAAVPAAPTLARVALSVLGPLRLEGPAGAVAVPGRKTREVLTLLALATPRPLSVEALADRL